MIDHIVDSVSRTDDLHKTWSHDSIIRAEEWQATHKLISPRLGCGVLVEEEFTSGNVTGIHACLGGLPHH